MDPLALIDASLEGDLAAVRSLLRAERSRLIYAELAKQGDGGALYIRQD